MKKALFTLLVSLGIAMVSQAQFELKFQAGLNTSHLTSEHVKWGHEGRIGYQFGVSAIIGEKFYVEPGVSWVTSTKDLYEKSDTTSLNFTTHINMIRIPVLLGYHVLGSEETLADLRIFAGPAGSFITGVKSDSDDLSKDDFKKFIFDIDAGAAVDVWIFFLEWHYVFGLTPVFNEDSDAKLQAFYGNLGVRIKF